MIRLYDFDLSGNAHKVRNLLSLLAVEHEREPVDLLAGEQKRPAFRALNPFGQVPVLVDGDVVVRDSAAILVYLGRKYGRGEWLPVDAEGEARVQEWLSVVASEIADGPGRARLIVLFGAGGDLAAAQARAADILERLESHLLDHAFLAAPRPTIADIAAYSYVALAPDGGVDLSPHPRVRAWLARLEKLPRFEPAPRAPLRESVSHAAREEAA